MSVVRLRRASRASALLLRESFTRPHPFITPSSSSSPHPPTQTTSAQPLSPSRLVSSHLLPPPTQQSPAKDLDLINRTINPRGGGPSSKKHNSPSPSKRPPAAAAAEGAETPGALQGRSQKRLRM